MKTGINTKRILYIMIPLVLVGIVVIKLKSNKTITQNKVYQFDKTQEINVEANTIELQNINAEHVYAGTFEPNKETKVNADIQGKVNAVLVDIGSVVSKGQTLIQLDNSLLKLQLQTVDVQIEGLTADVNRYTILANADAIQGVQLEKATLGLKSANVQKATLLEQINKTSVKAPFNGVVTAKLTEEGAFAAPGVPLLQITDITLLKFTINVPENDLKQFKLNQTYTITADAYSDVSLYGKTLMIGSKANMGSSFPIQFAVNNTTDLKVKSGMFGKVNLTSQTTEKGIVIPASALINTGNQAQVYVVKNGKAVLQNITVANKIQNNAVISNGLNVGDVIVTNGFINLFDGANVLITN